MNKRVVITGMEIVSSIGSGLETFWHNAINGVSGTRTIQSYNPESYTTQVAGEVLDLSLDSLPHFNKEGRFSKAARYALFCTHNAIKMSGLSPAELKLASTHIGTSLGGIPELENAYEAFYTQSWKKIPALSVLRGMPNSIANNIAIHFGIEGQNSTISNACLSSAEAIGNAYNQILYGKTAIAVCGGTESLVWESIMAAWCKLRVMSTNNSNPSSACRPFDKTRDGLVMADGAGILILEDLEHAKARGAKIYGEITGVGFSCDAYHVTAPSTQGQSRAILAALDDARLTPNDVQYINSHGTGTMLNDYTETLTIKNIFQEHAYDIPISAQKSMTGHAIGAAGAMEIIATVLSLQHDILLPTINLNTADPDCDLNYIANKALNKKIDIALSNHFAFGGANAAIIVQRT